MFHSAATIVFADLDPRQLFHKPALYELQGSTFAGDYGFHTRYMKHPQLAIGG